MPFQSVAALEKRHSVVKDCNSPSQRPLSFVYLSGPNRYLKDISAPKVR